MIWTTSVWWTRRCVRKTAQPGTAGSSFSSSWYRVLCISSFCLSGLLSFTINWSLLNTMFSWIVWASILANHRPWRGTPGDLKLAVGWAAARVVWVPLFPQGSEVGADLWDWAPALWALLQLWETIRTEFNCWTCSRRRRTGLCWKKLYKSFFEFGFQEETMIL